MSTSPCQHWNSVWLEPVRSLCTLPQSMWVHMYLEDTVSLESSIPSASYNVFSSSAAQFLSPKGRSLMKTSPTKQTILKSLILCMLPSVSLCQFPSTKRRYMIYRKNRMSIGVLKQKHSISLWNIQFQVLGYLSSVRLAFQLVEQDLNPIRKLLVQNLCHYWTNIPLKQVIFIDARICKVVDGYLSPLVSCIVPSVAWTLVSRDESSHYEHLDFIKLSEICKCYFKQ